MVGINPSLKFVGKNISEEKSCFKCLILATIETGLCFKSKDYCSHRDCMCIPYPLTLICIMYTVDLPATHATQSPTPCVHILAQDSPT